MKNAHHSSIVQSIFWVFLLFCFMSCKKSGTGKTDSVVTTPGQTKPALKTNATGENAAPSEHINFSFPSGGIVKLQKIKIVQSANSSYFSVHNYPGGYWGFQQTSDPSYGTPNILISSLWDTNTAAGVYSSPSYLGAGTVSSRFGGEGDGTKTINPYKWKLNTWYNFAVRFWTIGGNIYVATFVQDLGTGNWFLTSTITRADAMTSLGNGGDSFLENWEGFTYDGRYKRKMFLKDFWNLNLNNVWEKHTSRYFTANAGDSVRNGIYDRAFNSGYDSKEDAYFMEHGGNVTPSAAFGTGRTLNLPAQTNQGNAPVLTIGAVSTVTASYTSGTVKVNWTINSTKSPQYSSKVEILNSSGTVVNTSDVIQPERRSVSLTQSLPAGSYTARVIITDIFNQVSAAVTRSFSI